MFIFLINAHWITVQLLRAGEPTFRHLYSELSRARTMAESSSSGDEEFKNETKYKQYSAAVDRSLKAFELSSEWHDLISSLARLNKASTEQSKVFLGKNNN